MATQRRKARIKWRQIGPPLLLIAPSVILVGVFVYGLIAANVATSLRDAHTVAQYNAVQPTTFVGFENHAFLFGSPDFQHSLMNLLLFSITFLIGTLTLGFLWAWILERPIKGEGFFRAIFLFPMAVSFIASGVVWRWLLNPGQGESAKGLNRLFQMLGLGFLENSWTGNITWGITAVALPAIWQLAGYVMAQFLAGFRCIPDELKEAARVDGASEWQVYRRVIFPQPSAVALSTSSWR